MVRLYPVLAKIQYSDNHINLKFNLNIKKFQIGGWKCSKCNAHYSFKVLCYEAEKYASLIEKPRGRYIKDPNNSNLKHFCNEYVMLPDNKFICPYCFYCNKSRNVLEEMPITFYKVYTSTIKYIDMCFFLSRISYFNYWKTTGHFGSEVMALFRNFEYATKVIIDEKSIQLERLSKSKKVKLKITMNKDLKEEELELAYDKYLARSVARKI